MINRNIFNSHSIPYQKYYTSSQHPSNQSLFQPVSHYKKQSPVTPFALFKNKDQSDYNSITSDSEQSCQIDWDKVNETKSPLEFNLVKSMVKSHTFTSEQYYRSDDQQTHKINFKYGYPHNQSSRRVDPYFPTQRLITYEKNNQKEKNTSNYITFQKISNQILSSNFDTHSKKSNHSSRIHQMNQKIDQNTQYILRKGLFNKKNKIIISSGHQQRNQNFVFQSPKNTQKIKIQFGKSKFHSSIDRKRQAQDKKQQNLIKNQQFHNQEQQSSPIKRRQYFPSNKLNKFSGNQNQKYQLGEFNKIQGVNRMPNYQQINFDLDQGKVQFSQNKQISKQFNLPSTNRKDITFNSMKLDSLFCEPRIFRNQQEFQVIPQINTQVINRDYTSQINCRNINPNKLEEPRHYKNVNFSYQNSQHTFPYTNQFDPSKSVIINQIDPRLVSNQLNHYNRSSIYKKQHSNDFNRNNSKQKLSTMKSDSNSLQLFQSHKSSQNKSQLLSQKKELFNSPYSNKQLPHINNQKILKRTSSANGQLKFLDQSSDFQRNDSHLNLFSQKNNFCFQKSNYPQYYDNNEDFQFKQFENNEDGLTRNMNLQTVIFDFKNNLKLSEKNLNKISNPVDSLQKIRIHKNEASKNTDIVQNQFPSKREPYVEEIPHRIQEKIRNYINQIKDKQGIIVAILLITLAAIIFILQLFS